MVWGIYLEEVKGMNLFKRKGIFVDPRAKRLVDKFREVLRAKGITDEDSLDECTWILTLIGIKANDEYNDGQVAALEKKFRVILTLYGFPNEEDHDFIMTEFYDIIRTLTERGKTG